MLNGLSSSPDSAAEAQKPERDCHVEWNGKDDRQLSASAELLAVSKQCIALQGKRPFIQGTKVVVRHAQDTWQGQVHYCFFRKGNYYFGVEAIAASGARRPLDAARS